MNDQLATSGDNARATLSKELSEFLIEFSIALHKHAMYPSGHPSLPAAAEAVARRATLLLRDRSSLSLGIARDQLIIEGVATESKHPVLAELAGRLHRHHLGAVSFHNGITPDEVSDLLRVLSAEADRTGEPLGLGNRSALERWQHARLHAITYEKLELLEDSFEKVSRDADAGDAGHVAGAARVRSAQLWIGMARAALAGQIGDAEEPSTQPAVIARAIDEHPRNEAYDQVVVGYLLQIAEELRESGSDRAAELRRRTAQLVRELRPETLQRLIMMGGDSAQRRRFVSDATEGMAVESIVDIVKAAADVSKKPVSTSLLRLFSKLAVHAESGSGSGKAVADAGLRDQVQRLLADWHQDDPNPANYGAALQRLATSTPIFSAPSESQHRPDDLHLVQISMETGSTGPMVHAAIARLTAARRIADLLNLLDTDAPGLDTPAGISLRSKVANTEQVRILLNEEPRDLELLDRLIAATGLPAAEPLLDALAVAESRSARAQIVERIRHLGPAIAPQLLPRLDDSRWYVVRNMLVVMDEWPSLPDGFSPATLANHADARVRKLALKLRLKMATGREDALISALSSDDVEVVRFGLLAAHVELTPRVQRLVEQLASGTHVSSDLRVIAIRALGHSRATSSMAALLGIVNGGRSMLGKLRLARKSPELLAALPVLAARWSRVPDVERLLNRAAESRDAEIRSALTQRDAH